MKQVEQSVPKSADAELSALMAGGIGGRSQVGFGGAELTDGQGEQKDMNKSRHHDELVRWMGSLMKRSIVEMDDRRDCEL